MGCRICGNDSINPWTNQEEDICESCQKAKSKTIEKADSRNCSACSKDISTQDKFCANCGAKIVPEESINEINMSQVRDKYVKKLWWAGIAVLFLIAMFDLLSTGNKLSNSAKGETCRLASVLALYDEEMEDSYYFLRMDGDYPVIRGLRGWYFKCRFEGSRIYVTGKHPKNGWRTGSRKWNDGELWGVMRYKLSGSLATVTHTSSDGSSRAISSYIEN